MRRSLCWKQDRTSAVRRTLGHSPFMFNRKSSPPLPILSLLSVSVFILQSAAHARIHGVVRARTAATQAERGLWPPFFYLVALGLGVSLGDCSDVLAASACIVATPDKKF